MNKITVICNRPHSIDPSECAFCRVEELETKLAAHTKHEWVGLTDEDIDGLHSEIKVRLMGTFYTKDIYRTVEAKLKEKNT
jgi:hypothetical protein